MAAMWLATSASVNAEEKLLRQADKAVLIGQLSSDQLLPLPPDTPMQRWTVGKGLVEGGSAGATGTEVYRNTMGVFFFPPGTNVNIADDLLTIAVGGCDMSWIEIGVTGGGNGTGPGFTVTFSLFNGCPNQGGVQVPGTQVVEMLPNNGGWLVNMDYEAMLVDIPEDPWLRVRFSNATAGPILGAPAEIGSTMDLFDHPMFPCVTDFVNPAIYSGFYADIFCGGDVGTQFEAYRADVPSGFFSALELPEMHADDIIPITAPAENCQFVRYDSTLAGLDGPYTMRLEVFSHDETNNRPMAPVVGTVSMCNGAGAGELTTCTLSLANPIEIPTPQFWLTYDVSGNPAGPILVGDFPPVGNSEDGFSIFGMPDAGVWSQAIWFFGGCPEYPCGTFQNSFYCFGTAPMGACCDLAGAELCTNDTTIQQCADGRWMPNAACEADPFDPPCGTSACCTPDESCSNLTQAACAAATGVWQSGLFCGAPEQMCPPIACIGATNSCFEENDAAPGCSDGTCCALVCQLDSFCCDVAWDQSCADNATANCPFTPVNDNCANAIAVVDGTYDYTNQFATTDGAALPAVCEKGGGVMLGNDLWYNYTPMVSGMATVTLCGATNYDSRIAVFMGCGCPADNANIVECDDDACEGVDVEDLQSEMSFPVTAGQCYKLRVGGWNNEVGSGSFTLGTEPGTGCPSGMVTFVSPPSGVVDARQPNPVNSPTPLQGISTIMVTAPEGGSADCWTLCETAQGQTPNSIQSVMANGTNYTITLARPITPGAVTTLKYTRSMGGATTGVFTSHPANVNGDSAAGPNDILRVVDCLNNVNPGVNCPHGLFSRDIDQSGVFGPADILRAIDLLNGADVFIPWNNTSLPMNTCP
jgi:hypothetical protein